MRLIKIFGPVAVTAVSAMAFLGASSAMAELSTAICQKDVAESCIESSQAKSVHLTAKNGILLTGEAPTSVTCKDTLFSGTLLGLGKPQQVHPFELKYTGCTTFFGIFTCSVSATHIGLLDILKITETFGTVADLEVEGKFTEVNVNCPGGVNCTYSGKNLFGFANSAPVGTNGAVEYFEQTVQNVAGANCPKTATLDIKFVSLTPLYIQS